MGLNKKEKYSNQQLQYLSHAIFFHAKFVECSNQFSSIVLDELSSYWSVTKTCYNLGFSLVTISKSGFHWSAFGNQQGSTFTETNRNGLIHHIGCLIALSNRMDLFLS